MYMVPQIEQVKIFHRTISYLDSKLEMSMQAKSIITFSS